MKDPAKFSKETASTADYLEHGRS